MGSSPILPLSSKEIWEKYHDLRNVDASFRVTKRDLAVRPVFHWKPRQIKTHIAIFFTIYSPVKQMQYRIKVQYENLGIEKIRQSLIRIQTSILFIKRREYNMESSPGCLKRLKRYTRSLILKEQ